MGVSMMRLSVLLCVALLVVVSSAEMSRGQAFDAADGDGDGKLTGKELAAALENIGHRKPSNKKERASALSQMDKNGDRRVDKTEFVVAMERGDSLFGKIGSIATRVLDNVGLLNALNDLAVAIGITPGNQIFDLTCFMLLSAFYLLLVKVGYQVSYISKFYAYAVGFALTVYAWLVLFSALDYSTEYCAGFTVICFLIAVVGTADSIMDEAGGKKNKKGNSAAAAKRRLGKR